MNRLFKLCLARRLLFFEPSSVHAGSARFVVPDKYQIAWRLDHGQNAAGGVEEEERRKERGGKEREDEGWRKGERGKFRLIFFAISVPACGLSLGLGMIGLGLGLDLNFCRQVQGSQARPATCLLQ